MSRLPVSGNTGVDLDIAELLSVTEESAMIDLEVIGQETHKVPVREKWLGREQLTRLTEVLFRKPELFVVV